MNWHALVEMLVCVVTGLLIGLAMIAVERKQQ
jgi:hypothetical protein